MNTLSKIDSFGAIDAENDSRLLDCFYRASIIDDLLSNKRSIVIGRKGSGKTAIYKYIKSIKQDHCAELLFKDYPWKIHDQFKNSVVSQRESYINSWTFFLYIEILKKMVLLQDKIDDKSIAKEVKKVARWLKRNWGSLQFDHRETLSPQRSKFSFTFSPQVLGNSLGSVSRDINSSDNLGGTLSEYNKKIDSIIQKTVPTFDGEIILMFDELDLSYAPDSADYNNRLIGLLLATYYMHNKFDGKIRIIVFLRNDIFNQLEFQDKNKIKDNLAAFLDWEAYTTNSALSLKSFVAHRIREIVNSESDNFDSLWGSIFDNNKIGTNQFKWNYIIERTFMRPRDLLKFMNLALAKAKKRIENDSGQIERITNADIRSMKTEYSTYLFEELRDEILGKYPDYNKYIEILREVHIMTFSFEDFSICCEKLRKKHRFPETSETILERLYEFSIIGFYKPGGGGYGGAEYRYQYNSDYQAFNSKAQKFRVHAGLKDYLELIEKSSKRSRKK